MKPSELIKFKRPLRAHQVNALDRFATQSNMALLWEMGTGKSTGAVAWLRAKYNIAKEITPTLIVSPCATLYNWEDEFKINAPDRVVAEVLVPYKKTRKMRYSLIERAELIASSGKKIIIINPESFDSPLVVKALKDFSPRNVIIDEADGWKKHDLSHPKTKHKPTRLGNLVSVTDRAENRAIMTGTLILNSYLDIWAPWRIMDKGETFGSNFYGFREKYFRDKNERFKGKKQYFPMWVSKEGIESDITRLLSLKASRVLKSECLDLPPLITQVVKVELGSEQAKAYYDLERDLVAEVRSGTCSVTNALAKMTRMMQILAGYIPVLDSSGDEDVKALHFFKSNPRLDQLESDLIELVPNHKVIVWVTYAGVYPLIRSLFKKHGWRFTEITGESSDHHGAKEEFQNDKDCRIIMSNPKAGGIGINLTAGDYSLYYGRTHSRREREQSKARNHRGGSEIHRTIIHRDYVASDTLDVDVLEALERKESFSENILAKIKDIYK